jgi:hypothetical protein
MVDVEMEEEGDGDEDGLVALASALLTALSKLLSIRPPSVLLLLPLIILLGLESSPALSKELSLSGSDV